MMEQNTLSPQLSIVIPAWNEAENLAYVLPAIHKTLATGNIQGEILVIDGGSVDDSAAVAERFGARFLLQRERGYGGALLRGFEAAKSDCIVTMDADLSHPPEFILEFWRRHAQADLLIASRYLPGGRSETGWVRAVLSIILNRTFAFLLQLPIRDMSSGFRMYRSELLRRLTITCRDFDVLEEILVLAHLEGSSIVEIPFHYKPRGSGQSHVRFMRFAVAYAKTLFRLMNQRWLAQTKAVS
ncbi:MAG: glycosyltransferase [Acidobacteriaceae bacterium]|nr:glycosyltransferase [Acidobacteriaceae bacterium]